MPPRAFGPGHTQDGIALDDGEFTDLIRGHAGLIHKIAHAYCRNVEDRNDLVQEVVIQLWRSRDRYDGRVRRSTWIYRIALNVAISRYRRERRHEERRAPVADDWISLVEDPTAPPNEDLETLHRCIDELDGLNKALVLLYLDGEDHATIADVLGITATNVATKLSRIKVKLRAAFEKRNDPEGAEAKHGTR